MELLLVFLGLYLFIRFGTTILYSRKDWEREIAKQDKEEPVFYLSKNQLSEVRRYSVAKGWNSLLNSSFPVNSIAEKVLPKVSSLVTSIPKKVFNLDIYGKIDEIAAKIRVNTKFTVFVIIFWLVLFCLLANEVRNYVIFLKSMSFYNILDILVALTSLCLIALVVYFLVRDIGGIVSLRQGEDVKATVDRYVRENRCQELKKYLLSQEISKSKQKELKYEFKYRYTARDVIEAYEKIVIEEYDEQVHQIIREYRNKVIIGNGISGSSLLDFVVNLYCYYQILSKTAQVYRKKFGVTSLFRVLGTGCLVCYAVSKTTNLLARLTKTLFDGAFISGIPATPIEAIIQAITSGFSMQIYGYWLKYTLRPIKSYNQSMKDQTIESLKEKTKEWNPSVRYILYKYTGQRRCDRRR